MIAIPFVAIDVLLVVLWTIAAALAIALIMDKLGGILSGVPWVGGKLSDAAKAMGQAITNACGHLMSGTESLVGGGLHWLARHFDTWFNQFVAHAVVIAHLAQVVGNEIYSVSGLRSLVHELTKRFHGIEAGVKSLVKEWHGIEARVKALERAIAKGIGHDLRIQVKALERDVAKIDNTVIPAIRSEVATAENNITALGEYIRSNFVSDTTDALTAAVAVGLAGLGLGGLRCSNFGRLLTKFGCGLGSLLNDLLGLAISALALEAVCDFLPLLEDAFGAIIGPMTHLLNEVPLGACEQMPESWATLNVAVGPTPPAQTLGAIPS